jgi:hypothetical protein
MALEKELETYKKNLPESTARFVIFASLHPVAASTSAG